MGNLILYLKETGRSMTTARPRLHGPETPAQEEKSSGRLEHPGSRPGLSPSPLITSEFINKQVKHFSHFSVFVALETCAECVTCQGSRQN